MMRFRVSLTWGQGLDEIDASTGLAPSKSGQNQQH
jgi:hypothetical protein